MVKHTRCSLFEPNDWVEYVDADTGKVLAVDRFYNEHLAQAAPGVKRNPPPPMGWDYGEER